MTLYDVTYAAGTQKSTQQTKISEAAFTDTDHVQFTPSGKLETIDPYSLSSYSSDYVTLLGAVRSTYATRLTGANEGVYEIHGSNTRLYAIKNNELYNITPFAGQRFQSLGTDPLSFAGANTTMSIAWTAHGLAAGDYVTLSGADDLLGIAADTYINTRHQVASVVDANSVTVTVGTASSGAGSGGGSSISAYGESPTDTLGTDPLAVVSGDATMTVTYTGHDLAVGDRIKLYGATDSGGVTAATYINIEHIVATVIDADTFTVELGTNASSTDSAAGGSAIDIFTPIASGNLQQGSASGYGIDEYGAGVYGLDGDSGAVESFPRIWSIDVFGNELIACPGDYTAGDGQKVYIWDGDVTAAATVLRDAPEDANFIKTVNNSVVAACGRTIKISELGSAITWSGLLYRANELQNIWKIITIANFGERDAILLSPNKPFYLRYVGGADIWDISELDCNDGIISPMSHASLNGVLYWRSARGLYQFSGNQPRKVPNEQNYDWQEDNVNYGAAWTAFAYADTKNEQIWWHFPTGSATDPTDYYIYNIGGQHHTLGLMNRTSAQRPGMLDQRFTMVNSTSTSTAGNVYRHYTTSGSNFSWYAKTALFYAGSGNKRMVMNRFIPDSNQDGDITLTPVGYEYPQGSKSTFNSYTISATSGNVTVRASGRLLGMEFSGNAQASFGAWKMGIGGQ